MTKRIWDCGILLRQVDEGIGIWDLKAEDWYLEPFTDDRIEAHGVLTVAREILSQKYN